MQQVMSVLKGLDTRKRVVLGFATIAMFVAVLAVGRMATAPNMTLLYAGLDAAAAGDVVRALEQNGAAFEVRGGSIFVDAQERDALRMTLASDGLPMNGARGYELLDGLNGFGTTSQMFDAAYWRAKEGELARTIVSNPAIQAARVHIANASSNPFVRSVQPTASVALTTSGPEVSAAQAKAFQHLVASAVAGLRVEDVAIMDSNGMILGAAETPSTSPPSLDLSTQIKDRVARLVEARVGRGNAVVEVSVETETERESIRERLFDPESRVAISTDTEERANASTQQADGVTVASNLPDGDAATGEGSTTETTETRERVNYEVSETERELIRAPGAIKKLSVAVLVNGFVETDETGTEIYRDRSEDELVVLRDLIASAVGFDEARGDSITIRSMELPATAAEGTLADAPFFTGMQIDAMRVIQMVIAALVAVVLALFVIRPLLNSSTQTAVEPAALPYEPQDVPDDIVPLTGELDPAPDTPVIADSNWQSISTAHSDPVERLKSMIGDRQEETVEILRTWLEDKEKTA